MDTRTFAARIAVTKVLVVDDDYHMRKVVRTLLTTIGVRTIYEAGDGLTGLEMIRKVAPHVVILDWEMPGLDGVAFLRAVRSPDRFPYPNVPIIMLTGHGERQRVVEAISVGVNEFLLKPVSVKALRERLVAVLANPRPIIRSGDYYGPLQRKLVEINKDGDEAVASLYLVN
jgi:two-component system chemotaxis response regulator CheY